MKRVLVILASVVVAIVTGSAQAPAPMAGPSAKVAIPRTPDGKPDFTGNWTNATITPLERLPNRPLVLTEATAREMEISTRQALAAREETGDDGAARTPEAATPATENVKAEVAQFERRWQAGFGDVRPLRTRLPLQTGALLACQPGDRPG